MVDDKSARLLHDKATRGGTLTDAERARLEAWYEQQDATEAARVALPMASAANVQSLRIELEMASAQLLAVTQNIQTLAEENNALRREIATLSQQLARTASSQVVGA